MKFELRDEYKTINITECNFSDRTVNALIRNGVKNLLKLVSAYNDGIKNLEGIGVTAEHEIDDFLVNGVKSLGIRLERNESYLSVKDIVEEMLGYGVPDDEGRAFLEHMEYVDLDQMFLSIRTYNGLRRSGINTLRDFLLIGRGDLLKISGVGARTVDEIKTMQKYLWSNRNELLRTDADEIRINNEGTLEPPGDEEEPTEDEHVRDLDKEVIEDLRENFGFSNQYLCDWFGVSKQRIYQKLSSRRLSKDKWTGKAFTETDREGVISLIENLCFYIKIYSNSFYLFNNRKDNCVIVCVNNEEIKCFYLNELPEDIQDLIRRNMLEVLTLEEIEEFRNGRVVNILKVPHFMPRSVASFRQIAKKREMTTEEYSLAFTGMPYGGGKSITDDKIIEFFESHLVNGKVYISSDPENQWIRAYSSRNGYGLEEFVELYGYEKNSDSDLWVRKGARERHIKILTRHIVKDNEVYLDTASRSYRLLATYAQNRGTSLNEYISKLGFQRTLDRPVNDVISDERDMEEYTPEDNAKLIERIYANHPILGNYVFSDSNLQSLYSNAKQYIDRLVRDSNYFGSSNIIKAEMQVTLAVINYAKNWTSSEESSFWNYISGQFGYRDNSNEVRNVICRCIEDSLHKTNRFFHEDQNGKQYKTTIVVHALTTKKTWMYVFDFLFDFYKNNLDWTYVENDPSIGQMVKALFSKLSDVDDSNNDEDISISANTYRFQEGVRKLLLYRPRYAEKMLNRMIRRIDSIIRQEAGQAKTYEEYLIDEWFLLKMKSISSNRAHSGRGNGNEVKRVAISYDRIHAVYRLGNETDISIVLPDVRLKEEDNGPVVLEVYNSGKLIETRGLSCYGNELGRTISEASIDINRCRRLSGDYDLAYSIRVICGSTVIYDSESSLYRRIIVFSKNNEVNPSSCTKGNYVIFTKDEGIETENADISTISEDVRSGNYYSVQLKNDFILKFGDQILAIDGESNKSIRTIIPNTSSDLTYVKDGKAYRVTQTCDTISIIVNDNDSTNKYVILLNDHRISLDELNSATKGNNIIYELPVSMDEDNETCHVQIMDLNRNKLVLDEWLITLDDLDYEFDKPIYYDEEDYEDAHLDYSFGETEMKSIPISKDDESVDVPYLDGELSFVIPKLVIQDSCEKTWNKDAQYWIDDVGHDSFLRIIVPDGVDLSATLGEKNIPEEADGRFGLGNAVHGSDYSDKKSVKLLIDTLIEGELYKQYLVGRIVVKEKFFSLPKIEYDKGVLLWDKGHGFIGKKGTAFSLMITSDDGFSHSFNLNLDDEVIESNIELPVGEYKYQITKASANIFDTQSVIIAEGTFVIGNINELRFRRKIIRIDKVSFYDYYTDRVRQEEIPNIYIDQIEFLGMETVGDDGELPVYKGTAFYNSKTGQRREFSFENKPSERGLIMKVNPVKIALINDSVLGMVDMEGDSFNEGDGFYCYSFRNADTGIIKYTFTDREYTESNKKYYRGIDLYMYEREGVEDNV